MSFLGFAGEFFLDFMRFFVHKPIFNRSFLSVDNPYLPPKPRCGKEIFPIQKARDSTSPWISLSRDSTRVSARKAAYIHLSLTKLNLCHFTLFSLTQKAKIKKICKKEMPLPQGVALQPTRFFEKKRDKKQTWGSRNLSETHREAIAAVSPPRVVETALPLRSFREEVRRNPFFKRGFSASPYSLLLISSAGNPNEVRAGEIGRLTAGNDHLPTVDRGQNESSAVHVKLT